MTDCPILKENEELRAEIAELERKLKEANETVRIAIVDAKEKQ